MPLVIHQRLRGPRSEAMLGATTRRGAMDKMIPAMAVLALLSACGGGGGSTSDPISNQVTVDVPAAPEEPAAPAAPDNESASATPLPTDAWVGKWVGVEGLALDIQPGATPGVYALTVQLMDTKSSYEGHADGAVIRFQRGDRQETISHVAGSETDLKWLADKKNCLMIRPGEGFCRPE
jgi:hypothetical protein